MSLKITTNPTPNEINEIYEGLLTHNLHYIQMEQYTPLAVFKDESGKKIGGITGGYFRKLATHSLFVGR